MKKITKILREKGKSQSWLARELGVSRQRLSQLLKQDKIYLDTAFKISDALEVDINEFRKE